MRSPLTPARLPLPDCARCGHVSRLVGQDKVAELLREYAAEWQRLLIDPELGERSVGVPAWSPLEHGCHVRDMCLLFHVRLDAMLGTASEQSSASSALNAPDAARRYRDEAPRQVAEELGRAAEALARRLAALTAEQWDRDDPRLADPRLTVDFFTRHLLHDIAHDLAEVLRGPERQQRTQNEQ
ncbi:hypothetical protein AB0I82_28040 [Streptomyces sp. NPDC050315]|uniref:hypothetical protein n=1 Tax=Streptomyces sp. NPDC050315 TaxID=3155039 RepID=UPI00342EB6D8